MDCVLCPISLFSLSLHCSEFTLLAFFFSLTCLPSTNQWGRAVFVCALRGRMEEWMDCVLCSPSPLFAELISSFFSNSPAAAKRFLFAHSFICRQPNAIPILQLQPTQNIDRSLRDSKTEILFSSKSCITSRQKLF